MLIRNFLRYLVISVFLFVVVEFLFLNYLLSPYLSKKIPQIVEEKGLKISIGEIYFYPVYPALDLTNINFYNKNGTRMASIKKVSIIYSILGLMRKKLIIHHLIVKEGNLFLPMNEDFKIKGLPDIEKKSSGGKSFHLKIGDLLIENFTFGMDVEKNFSLSQKIKILTFNTRKHRGKIFLSEGYFKEGPIKIVIKGGSSTLQKQGQSININDGTIKLNEPEGILKFALSVPDVQSSKVQINFYLNSSLEFLNKQLFSYPSINGNAEIKGILKVGGNKPFHLKGIIIKSSGKIEGEKFIIKSSSFSISPTALYIKKLNLSYGRTLIKGYYSLNFSSLNSEIEVKIEKLDFQHLPWTKKILQGTANGKVSLTGTFSPLRLKFSLRELNGQISYIHKGNHIELPGKGILNSEGLILSDRIKIEHLQWKGGEELEVSDFVLLYDNLASKGKAIINNLSMEKFSSIIYPGLSGKIKGNINWKITPGHRLISGIVRIEDFHSPFLTVDLVHGPFTLSNDILRIALRLKKEKGSAFAGGFINVASPDKSSNLKLYLSDFPTNALIYLKDKEISGKIGGEVTISGYYPKHSADGNLIFKGEISGIPTDFAMNTSGKDGNFLIKKAIIKMGKNKLTLIGKISETGNIKMKAFAYISNLPEGLDNIIDIHNGEITMKITGKIINPDISTHGRFFKVCLQKICFERPDIYASVTDKNLFFIFFNKEIKIGGAIYYNKNKWITGINFMHRNWSKELGIREFVQLMFGLKGYLKGTLIPFNIESGNGKVEKLLATRENFSLKGDITFMTARKNSLILSGELKGTGGEIYIDSRINNFNNLDLNISGYFDLFYVSTIFPQVNSAGGFIAFDLGANGTWKNLVPKGKLEFINSRITLTDFPQPFLINGNLDILENRIILREIKISSKNGGGVLRGEIPINNLKPAGYNLFFNFQDLELTSFEGVDIVAGGELSLTGAPENLLLGGNIEILRGIITRKVNIQEEILKRKRNITIYQEKEPLHLNIKVFSKGGFFIRNNLADMEIKFDLILQGTPSRLKIAGSVDLLKGSIIFRERKFFLETGTINFNGLYPPDPFVDARFNAEIEDLKDNYTYRVNLTAQGPVSNLRILLESQPPLSETDILSLIIFGVKTSALVTPSTGRQTGVVETGNLIFSHQLGTLEGKMEELMGFDVISISPSFSDVSKHSTFKLKLTKRLSPKLGVTFSTSDYQELEISYLISKNIRLEVGWDNKLGSFPGNFSVSPHFYYEFNW